MRHVLQQQSCVTFPWFMNQFLLLITLPPLPPNVLINSIFSFLTLESSVIFQVVYEFLAVFLSFLRWCECWLLWITLRLLSFIFPVQTNIYSIFDPKVLTFLPQLRLGLSHLNEHRFWHNFQDCLNPLCSCSLEIEDTSHYLLHCHHFSHHRVVLMNSVKSFSDKFGSMSDNVKEDSRFDENKKVQLLTYNSDHSLFKIFRVNYCYRRYSLACIYFVLFLVAIIIIEKKHAPYTKT